MAEPDKRQIGDGQDNYGQAIQQLTNASKQFGQRAAEQTAQRATEAAANAAAASDLTASWFCFLAGRQGS